MNSPRDARTESMMDEVLGTLHAPDDLAQRALAAEYGTTTHGRHRRHGHAHRLVTVAAAVLVALLACGGTAYAVINSDFFARAYGNHGLGGTNTWSITGDDSNKTTYTFSMDFDTITSDDVANDVANATEDVGLSVSAGGYTLTIETMLLDTNGAGAATFTLENPNGVRHASAQTNELWFDTDSDLRTILMRSPGGGEDFDGSIDSRCFYDADTSTDTTVHGTMYFNSQGLDAFKEGMCWELSLSTNETGTPVAPSTVETDTLLASLNVTTDTFTPSKMVGARTYSDGNGTSASLTPLSLRLAFPGANETIVDDLSLNLADGSTRAILALTYGDGGVSTTNYYVYYGWEDDNANYQILSLTQMANPAQVTSITMGGRRYPDRVTEEPFSLTLTEQAAGAL